MESYSKWRTLSFFLRMNKDHGTDCNLGKLHVCLQLYFTYPIYHLQTIPRRNMYQTFEKKIKIRWQSVFLSFVSDAADFICRLDSLYFEDCVLSCSSSFAFFSLINSISWNDVTTIKQRKKKTLQKIGVKFTYAGESWMLNISLEKKKKSNCPPTPTPYPFT